MMNGIITGKSITSAFPSIILLVLFVFPLLLFSEQQGETVYEAELTALNQYVAGSPATGKAEFRVQGDALVISISAQGAAPEVIHLQLLHGFAEGTDAVCPQPQQDTNADGVVDLRETEPTAGRILVPLNCDPAGLDIMADRYPEASREGKIVYQQMVSIEKLRAALLDTHGISDIRLENMVVLLLGVDKNTALPESAQSLQGVPPQTTLPIACGKIQKIKQRSPRDENAP